MTPRPDTIPASSELVELREHQAEQNLDEALGATFPASDPLACTPRQAGRNDKRMPVAARPPYIRQSRN